MHPAPNRKVSRREAIHMLNGLTLLAPLGPLVEGLESRADPAKMKWVVDTLKEMSRIQPGMTRADMLKVFREEGGLSTALEQTFVSQACIYFKVNVVFHPVGRPRTDEQVRETGIRDARDTIATISQPYLGWAVYD